MYLVVKYISYSVAVSCGYDTWFAVRLAMDYTTSHFTWSILGYLSDPTRSSLPEPDTQVSRCLWFPPNGSRIGTFHILPTGVHGLCFGSYFSGPLPLRSLLHGPLSRVHFGESLVVRLYSDIDQIHLSSEAQCVSHHLPPVDCHTLFHLNKKTSINA